MRCVTMLLVIFSMASVSQGRIEITPFGGHQGGGEFDDFTTGAELELKEDSVVGLMLGIGEEGANTQLEFYFSRQESQLEGAGAASSASLFELDIDYYHIGGTFAFGESNRAGKLTPYIAASLGATRFDPQPSNLDTHTKFSLGLGGGVKWFLTERVGLRLESRVFGTFIDTEAAGFSGPGGTVVIGHSDVLVQYNVTAGLIFVIP